MRAFLGMGSNLGDRWGQLREAVASLGSSVATVSPVYETEPVGGPRGQDNFLNVVVEIETDLTPRQLLGVCHRLEAAAGRVRGERWGPRTLDVDILLLDGCTIDEPDLTVPHPRMYERRFVMAPLADIAPTLVPEDWERRVEGSAWVAGNL
jgi:2-amino-4-hydroxy-6-hydroxymethyldihydropteridine diphosphokinase